MDLASSGHLVLYAAFGAAAWSAISSVWGHTSRDRRFIRSGQRALFVAGTLIASAVALLLFGLYSHDFSLGYVASYTSRSTSKVFTFTALWAGMEGSLLWWSFMTAAYSTTAVFITRKRRSDLIAVATAVFAGILMFFLGLLSFSANPFASLSPIPLDGAGLNPLLQSPFMAIHPVLLYAGLTGFIVPFGFAISSLVSGRLDVRWFTSTRRWTVLAWSFLTIGVILGGAWAYNELGWGGYWAWDPVENASLLPWLTGTAFLHSVMIQERRGMLKVWNVALILATYSLAIFGTFLTRSGLLSSVHTFSESPVGKYLLPLLAIILIGAFGLLGTRIDKLRSERHLDSLISRESAFLFNNLLFVAIAFTVLWGTLYPVIVEAIQGTKISVGPPFFNSVIVPIGLALLALTGIGPLIAWRKASRASLKRQFAVPLIAGAAAVLALAVAGVRSTGALIALSLCVFVAVATIGEFVSGARAHSRGGPLGWFSGLRTVIGRNRRRYGGYIVHLGIVLIFLGLAGNAFRVTWTGTISQGDSFRVGHYDIRYVKARSFATDEKMVNMAVMDVSRDGAHLATLTPQRNFHFAQRQPQSEIGLRTSLSEDLYLVLTRMDASRAVTIRAWINPLVAWIWIGGVVMAAGMIVIMSSKPVEEISVPVPAKSLPEKTPVPV